MHRFPLVYRLSFLLLAIPAFAQQTVTQPTTLLLQNAFNITSAGQYIDNRSTTMQCNVITFAITRGTGQWSVQLEYSDNTPPGNWKQFGTVATVLSVDAVPIGYGYGYHPFFRLNTTAGTTTSNVSCEKNFFLSTGTSNGLTTPNFTGIAKAATGINGLFLATGSDISTTIGSQPQGYVYAAPASGGPGLMTPRLLVASDIPALPYGPGTTGAYLLRGNGTGGFAAATSSDVPYTFPGGTTTLDETTYLSSQYIDVRSFGAVGVTGNCHVSVIDDQPQIQAALQYAHDHGPPNVYLPSYYCWPIQRHVWLPPFVYFSGAGRTSGYEVSSPGSLLIANANWASTNTTFPYSQMLWVTGVNATSGTYVASGGSFGSVVGNMEINCNDQVGCGNLLLVGRQEKSRTHDLLLTGGVPFGSGGYAYGVYEEGVDCNNTGTGPNAPPGNGCLFAGDGVGNPFSGQQGPDERIEIFPSYNAPSSRFVLWAGMGMNNYKGLRDSTINDNGAGGTYGEYFWGESTIMGPGLHTEGLSSSRSLYIGNIPAGSTCNGGTSDIFIDFDAPITIAACGAQEKLTFLNVTGGVVNNQTGAPVASTTDPDYYYSFTNQVSGSPGAGNSQHISASIFMADPGEYVHTGSIAGGIGTNGLNFYNGNSHSGMNLQVLADTGSTNMRGDVCSNLYWSHSSQLWNVGQNGAGDFECTGFGNAFYGVSTGQFTPGSTISQATFNGHYSLITLINGHTILGQNIISASGAVNVIDNGAQEQVHGVLTTDSIIASANSANTDMVGEVAFAGTASQTVSLAGTYVSHVECNVEPQFDIGSGIRPWVTYSGVSAFIINFSSAVTGTVGYSCTARN